MEHASDSRTISMRAACGAANRETGHSARRVADRRDSQRDARARRNVLAIHGRIADRARRALAARLLLGALADDGSRGGGSLAGGRHGAVYHRVAGKSHRVAARSGAEVGISARSGGRVRSAVAHAMRMAQRARSRPAVGLLLGGVCRLRSRTRAGERVGTVRGDFIWHPGAAGGCYSRLVRGSDLLLGSGKLFDVRKEKIDGTGTQAGWIRA